MKTLAGGYAYDALRRAGYSLSKQREALLRKAVERALEAGWLTDREIAQELGCNLSSVSEARKRRKTG